MLVRVDLIVKAISVVVRVLDLSEGGGYVNKDMTKRNDPVHIFHIYRKDGTAVFLHPFRKVDKLYNLLDRSEIRGHYGNEPRVESLTLFRNELYRLVEQEVKGWVSDARFIPRFLISSTVFLVSFLFLSFVVLTPVPVLDELAISLGLAILTYIMLGRKDMQSEGALKRRIALRTKVDAIVFTENEFVRRVENLLISREGQKPDLLIEELVNPDSDLLVAEHESEAAQMVAYLEEMFNSGSFRQTEKRLKQMQREDTKYRHHVMHKWLETHKIDVPLLSLYMDLKRKTRTGV